MPVDSLGPPGEPLQDSDGTVTLFSFREKETGPTHTSPIIHVIRALMNSRVPLIHVSSKRVGTSK
jgi:hypothetical protein